jgi:exoribonuclease R
LQLPCSYRKKTLSKQLPKELYLRTDLPCHTLVCGRPTCAALGQANAVALASQGGVAPAAGVLEPSGPGSSQYVVPTFEVLQRFGAWFARAQQVHLILLRTHANQAGAALTRQLRELLAAGASRRRAVLFENEVHAETATLLRGHPEPESSDERNERAMRRAARWFARHIPPAAGKRIVLLEAEPAPTEESVRAADERQQQDAASSDGEPEKNYPREMGGVLVHSMRSYLHWLISTEDPAAAAAASAASSSRSGATSGDVPTAAELLELYESLCAAEVAKVRARLQRVESSLELAQKLQEFKIELTRGLSLGDAGAAAAASSSSEAAADSAALPAPSQPLAGAGALMARSKSTPAPLTTSAGRSSGAARVGGASLLLDQEFDEHLPSSLALEGVRRGLLLRGHLHVNKYHAQVDASVDLGGRLVDASTGLLVESSGSVGTVVAGTLGEIFVSGQQDRNRAMEGDEVVVHLLPPTLWRAPTARKKISVNKTSSSTSADKTATGEDEEDATAAADPTVKPVPTGRVVCILQRNTRPYVCTLQLDDVKGGGGGGDFSLVVPMDERIPKIRIRTSQSQALSSQRLLVSVDEWPSDSKYPSGVYQRSLGRIGDLETGVRCILHELDITHPPFSVNQLRCLPERQIDMAEARQRKYSVGSGYHSRGATTPFSWTIPPAALQGRLDLRQSHRQAVCSIDPVGCVDIDDALSVLPLPNGNVQIGVHIADVSWSVAQNSVLDVEAARRGTSVYLTDRRLDMLPSTLSTDLCSLRGGTERLCVSVLWEVDINTGKVLGTWYGRTAIYNAYALSYEEAQYILDTKGGTAPLPVLPPEHPNARLTVEQIYDKAPQSSLTPEERRDLYPKIKVLLEVGRMLRAARLRRGALELHSLEVKFQLSDDASRKVVGVQEEAELEVHNTIAEWMVFANSTVAHAIWQRFPDSALLRHHPFPAPARFARLHELAESMGLQLDTSSNKSLANSLDAAERILAARDFGADSAEHEAVLAKTLAVAGSTAAPLDAQQQRSWMMKLLKETAARAMSEAQYFSTGSVSHQREFYHYGLSADFYTHFTSPIRRYADLVVHRQLLQVIELERAEFHAQKQARKQAKQQAQATIGSGDGGGSSSLPAVGSSALPTLAHSGLASSSLVTASSGLMLGNEALQNLARHLNAKNRAAKLAGSASQELFLACFLAGEQTGADSGKGEEEKEAERVLKEATSSVVPRSLSSPPPPPRVERCEALVVSLRSNGFIVLLPSYHVKGAVALVDRDGRAILAHPLALAYPEQADAAAAAAAASSSALTRAGGGGAPAARIDLNEASQTLTLSLSAPPSAPSSVPASVSAGELPLPLSRSFRVFEPVLVDVSLRPNQSRYRTPKPIFTLVWQPEEEDKATSGAKKGKGKATMAATTAASRPVASSSATKSSSAASAPLGAAASVEAASAAFSSGPEAPEGAKKKPKVASAGVGSGSSLYALMREAATSNRTAKVLRPSRNNNKQQRTAQEEEEEEEQEARAQSKEQKRAGVAAVPKNPFVSLPWMHASCNAFRGGGSGDLADWLMYLSCCCCFVFFIFHFPVPRPSSALPRDRCPRRARAAHADRLGALRAHQESRAGSRRCRCRCCSCSHFGRRTTARGRI